MTLQPHFVLVFIYIIHHKPVYLFVSTSELEQQQGTEGVFFVLVLSIYHRAFDPAQQLFVKLNGTEQRPVSFTLVNGQILDCEKERNILLIWTVKHLRITAGQDTSTC